MRHAMGHVPGMDWGLRPRWAGSRSCTGGGKVKHRVVAVLSYLAFLSSNRRGSFSCTRLCLIVEHCEWHHNCPGNTLAMWGVCCIIRCLHVMPGLFLSAFANLNLLLRTNS